MKAIQDVGGDLVALMDPSDSVGVIDSYFPKASYFKTFERFDRYCNERGDIDYAVVCSPNHLHFFHSAWAMRVGMNVICEKPLCLRERNLDALLRIEEETDKRVWNILQLRLSDVYQYILKYLEEIDDGHLLDVSLDYFAPRGVWYDYSWKANPELSGGLECNLGIHLLDLINQFFGDWEHVSSYVQGVFKRNVFFCVEFSTAQVYVDLSVDKSERRVLTIDGVPFDLTPDMKNLHTKSYEQILNGDGFGIEETRASISLCDELRSEAWERK